MTRPLSDVIHKSPSPKYWSVFEWIWKGGALIVTIVTMTVTITLSIQTKSDAAAYDRVVVGRENALAIQIQALRGDLLSFRDELKIIRSDIKELLKK